MDIEALQTFLSVEKNGSFTKAAEELFCTQAAISMRIKRLEGSLESVLFIRHSRHLELTREGAVFLPYARQMVNTYHSGKDHLLQARLMEQSEIQITSSSTPGTYIIPSVMYLFRQKYPYITVVNHVQYTKNVVSAVMEKRCPLGIVSQPTQVTTGELLCEPLLDDPLVLVVNPTHPWAGTQGIHLRQLSTQTFLISNPGTSLVRYLEQSGAFCLPPEQLYVSGNIEAIKRNIYSGQGVSVMSEYAVKQELRLGLLAQVPILDGVTLSRKIYSIYRKDEPLKLSTRMFLQFMQESAQDGSLIPV